MTDHGDDCYFFYYSTCTKGDSCPFRHCEAAMGNETVCSLWQEGRCFRNVCKFRHMEIKKNRKVIACYWETQPAGCQKPHCAFHHEKPRYIDGMYVPPDKVQGKMEEPTHEEPAPPPPAPLPTSANPQLRGVIKAETQENVPSPTHPPVVINPADDDEDEDDQFSEGEDGTRLTSPRKPTGGSGSDESLNFGVSTLEEIRLRKALKASMKRTGYPVITPHSTAPRTNGEKENFRLFSRPALLHVADDPVIFEEPGKPRGCVAERLGKKIFNNDPDTGGELPLKRSLADRLGRVVDEEDMVLAPQKVMKPIRERLGLSTNPIAPTESAARPMRERLGLSTDPVAPTEPAILILETNVQSRKAPEQIRIKSLEEIRQQKAAKSQSEKRKDSPAARSPTITKATKGTKRTITVQPASVKTFSEILHAKKKQWQEDELQKLERKGSSPKEGKQTQEESPKKAKQAQEEALKKAKQAQEDAPSKSPETHVPSRVGPPPAEVRVKTLEEIRREKAARLQAQQRQEPENKKGSDSEDAPAKKPRLLRITKPASPVSNTNDVGMTTRRTAGMTEKPVKVAAAAETNPASSNDVKVKPVKVAAAETNSASSNDVKVKTFDEIMREKRLRKQQMEEQTSCSTSQSDSSSEAEPCQKQTAGLALKRNISIKARMASTASPSSPSSDAPNQDTKPPIHQVSAPKSKPASPMCSTETAITAETSASVKQSSPPRQAEADSPSHSVTNGSKVSPGKRKRSSPPSVLSKQDSQGPSAEESPVDAKKKCFGQATESKVRPKLNVKPSVMKPAAQVKPGQKRKAAGKSAVAAVKPLNSATTAMEEPVQELPYKRRETPPLSSSAETQQSPAGPMSSTSLLSSGSDTSPVREDLPVIQQKSPVQVLPTIAAGNSTGAARQTCDLPQSPIVKTPTQSKSRRPSLAGPTSVAVDDFEELMNEFTDDHLDDDMDPGMGEDDLLQELSEMIDS